MPIKQASRTIIFEEFSVGEKASGGGLADRLDLMLDVAGLNDSQFYKISERLSVGSFDEFMKKFNPTIYEQQLTDGNGTVTYSYSSKKPAGPHTEYNAKNDKFFKLISTIYANRGAIGKDNVRFNYDQLAEIISPRAVQEDIKRKRHSLHYQMAEYLKYAQEKGEDCFEAKKAARQVEKIVSDIKKQYFVGKTAAENVKLLLPPLIADMLDQIDALDKFEKALPSGQSNQNLALMPADLSFDSNGRIKVEKVEVISDSNNAVNLLSDGNDAASRVMYLLEGNYDGNHEIVKISDSSTSSGLSEKSEEEQKEYLSSNDFVRDTLMRAFSGVSSTSTLGISRQALEEKLVEYADMYKNIQESFAHQMVNLVEKIMNVKVFFDHAAVNGIVKPKVIIANCKITDLMNGGEVETNFKKYMESLGNEITEEKIWYAVVPGIQDDDYADPDDDDVDFKVEGVEAFDISKKFKTSIEQVQKDKANKATSKDETVEGTVESEVVEGTVEGMPKQAKPMNGRKLASEKERAVRYDDFCRFMQMMKDTNIMVFFNFKANDYTSFASLNAEVVRQYKETVESLDNKDWGVLCYPNFTVIPKEHKRYEIIPNTYVELPSVYIDSSYVACAMMILAHNNEFLKSKGFPVNGDMPAVRFDYEVSFKNENFKRGRVPVPCWQIITTKMNRENYISMSEELKKELNADGGFGFCFCGDLVYYDGSPLKYTYVYKARTISEEYVTGADGFSQVKNYKPIFKPLVKQTVRTEGELGVDIAEMCSKANLDQSKENINNLLYKAVYGRAPAVEESVEYDKTANTVSFKYSSNAEQADLVINL